MSQTWRLIVGDARRRLEALPAGSVQTCITSPPYWGLRNYGTEGQLGLEPTPDAYVAALVEVCREVRRVLRDDGTLWLNLGDSYVSNPASQDRPHGFNRTKGLSNGSDAPGMAVNAVGGRRAGLKPKDLVGIPWLVAFALRADGWYLRADIVWNKPDPMPESVTDRPTKAHEYIFLLAPSDQYYYDHEAIKESAVGKPSGNTARATNHQAGRSGFATGVPWDGSETRNRRSVWTVTTQSYGEAHFATFPPALIEPCVLAGTSAEGCCAVCGAAWERIVEKGEPDLAHQQACGGDAAGLYSGQAVKDYRGTGAQNPSDVKRRILEGMRVRRTTGWQPTCDCEADVVPCTVLDPFTGSGTTGEVAIRLGRSFVGIELNRDYAMQLARPRLAGVAPLLAVEVTAVGDL